MACLLARRAARSRRAARRRSRRAYRPRRYRNGGLFIDYGVIEPRDPSLLLRPLEPQSEPVVEWRALTVALLDRLAASVRERLGKTPQEFPLACVLEGGSWAAGREIALERRPDGSAPIMIVSDSTLF